jgi:hypothetical protein
MPATTRFHDGVANPVREESSLVFHDPIAFHPAHGVFNTNSDRRETMIGRFLRGGEVAPTGSFLRLDDGGPVESKTLKAPILVEAPAVWQGLAFEIRDAVIMHLACIRSTQEAKVTGLVDHAQVFDCVALLLATIMVLLCFWIFWAVDRSCSPIRPTRGDVGTFFGCLVARSVAHSAAMRAGSCSCCANA